MRALLVLGGDWQSLRPVLSGKHPFPLLLCFLLPTTG
jgi:hypothetical protein